MQVFLRAVAVGARGAAALACDAVTPKPQLRVMSTQVPRAGPPEAAATGVSINGVAHALTSIAQSCWRFPFCWPCDSVENSVVGRAVRALFRLGVSPTCKS